MWRGRKKKYVQDRREKTGKGEMGEEKVKKKGKEKEKREARGDDTGHEKIK